MRPGTRVVHAGLPPAARGEPLLPGPVLASAFHLGGPGEGTDTYGRTGNPTWRRYEEALASLEGGDTVLFSSGLAAVTAVLLTTLRTGDTVVLPSDGYFLTRRLVADTLSGWGIEAREVPTSRPLSESDVRGARLVLLESPSNPWLDVLDLRAAAEVAHAAGALVAVDNTTATALGQQPLALGADLSVCSDTKATTGHGDVLLGHVAARDPALLEGLRTWRTRTGSIAGPFEAWLAHRSLGTLELRLDRQTRTGLAVATALRSHPAVRDLRHPGLPDDPAYAVASRQMAYATGLVSFELPSADAVAAFLDRTSLVAAATSFGGLHTSADRRAQWGDDVPAGFVRLSCGCEDPRDLVADLTEALDTIAGE